jgi:hypothetical protein
MLASVACLGFPYIYSKKSLITQGWPSLIASSKALYASGSSGVSFSTGFCSSAFEGLPPLFPIFPLLNFLLSVTIK